jgi:hypothetical protein
MPGLLSQENRQALARGLLDTTQAASNNAASTVAAPVDALAWALRKFGAPIPQAPFGGSDWMRSQGLMRDVQSPVANAVGETIGGVLPIAAAAKAPQIASGLLNMAENAMAQPTLNKQAGVFLMHTPTKPNPAVGTRYEREFMGGLADKTPRKIEDLKNSNLVLMPWDSTSRNFKVTKISDETLPTPVITTGGQDFSRDAAHIAADIGGASNFEIARRIQSRNKTAGIENIQAGGNGDVFMLPVTMGAKAENFSTMPSDAILQLFNNANLSKKDIKYLNDQVRNHPLQTPKGLTRPFGGFIGLQDPDVAQQLLTGARVDTTAGNLRKGMVSALTKIGNQRILGFNADDLSASLMDDALRGVDKGYAGNTLIKAVEGTPLSASTHPAYDTDFGGRYFGSLMNNIPAEVLMPKTFERISKELSGKKGDIRNMTLGAMEKRGSNFSEYVDDRVINSVNEYLLGRQR